MVLIVTTHLGVDRKIRGDGACDQIFSTLPWYPVSSNNELRAASFHHPTEAVMLLNTAPVSPQMLFDRVFSVTGLHIYTTSPK